MNSQDTEFLVMPPRFEAHAGLAEFHYRLGRHQFCETVRFPKGFDTTSARSDAFENLLKLSAVVLGVSYFKLRAPRTIRIQGFGLTSLGRELALDIHENGLGEFYARNDLKRFGRIDIVAPSSPAPAPSSPAPVVPPPPPPGHAAGSNLLLIGGGKDSLASALLLEEADEPFTPFAVNPKGPILSSIRALNAPALFVRRTLDEKLFELNKRPGNFNGHVPATAINTMLGALAGMLFGHHRIILSNERSASEANLVHDGRPVNHQHSKSLAHETLIRRAILQASHGTVNCFSLLRPLSEARIAQIFAASQRFDKSFSSCNANFKQGDNSKVLWCTTCPKCLFVYLMLAPFMSPERLDGIVGAPVLNRSENLPLFSRLSGLDGNKPWECVGETLEAACAMFALSRKAPWREHAVIATLTPDLIARYGEKKLIAGWNDLMKDAPGHHVPDDLFARLPLARNNMC